MGSEMCIRDRSYMAPEQAMGVTPLDRRVDIYSLTAVTYAMLTGHPPFVVRNIADIMARNSLPPPAIAERLCAPRTLDTVMLSGLAADRDHRPPTALRLAKALEMIAGQMEAAASARRPHAIVSRHASSRVGPPMATARYPMSQVVAPTPETAAPARSVSYYVFLALCALAVFAVSMFVTILVLR